jgi:glycosyltransferase involved in cell wall biosynthesis
VLVSVVLPCFNGADTPGVMPGSLARQTYSGDRELVFVNNGSADNSVAIAISYANRLPIRVVNAYSGNGLHGVGGSPFLCGL